MVLCHRRPLVGHPAALTLVLVAVALLALPAGAALITGVTTTTGVSVSENGGPEPEDYYVLSAFAEDCAGSCTSFTSNFAIGAGIEADPGENIRIDVTWTYTIDIVVSAAAGEAWELTVDSQLAGYLTLVDQGPGRARERLTDLTGTLDTAGLGLTGSMDLGGTDSVNSSSSVNQQILRNGSFQVTGGFGPTTVSMTFTLDGRLRSQCTGGGCGGQGDEAAIRLGLPSAGTPSGFTAGNYPGIDGDPASAHGHFLDVVLAQIPEPGSGALFLAAAPLLLALRRCRP